MDESIQRYVDTFKKHNVDGNHLINLNCDNIHQLGVHLVGHQEIILESVKLLKYLVSVCSKYNFSLNNIFHDIC